MIALGEAFFGQYREHEAADGLPSADGRSKRVLTDGF